MGPHQLPGGRAHLLPLPPRAGVTIRSAIDCLIAHVAMEHDLILLHNDRDFENIARVIPELTLA